MGRHDSHEPDEKALKRARKALMEVIVIALKEKGMYDAGSQEDILKSIIKHIGREYFGNWKCTSPETLLDIALANLNSALNGFFCCTMSRFTDDQRTALCDALRALGDILHSDTKASSADL